MNFGPVHRRHNWVVSRRGGGKGVDEEKNGLKKIMEI